MLENIDPILPFGILCFLIDIDPIISIFKTIRRIFRYVRPLPYIYKHVCFFKISQNNILYMNRDVFLNYL